MWEAVMRNCKGLLMFLALAAMPAMAAQQAPTLDQTIDRIIAQERTEIQSLRQYSPLVETYIQDLRPDANLGTVPAGDRYFLSQARLSRGVQVEPITGRDTTGLTQKVTQSVLAIFTPDMQFIPAGFLQMIYIDTNGFDRQHYSFEYVRREFLGEVRCLVFDVTPRPNSGKGRFLGRIWVEDEGDHIVRFNGAYAGEPKAKSTSYYYFHFDSWRLNA